MRNKAIKIGTVIFLIWLILTMLPVAWPAMKILPFGWLKFLYRTLPGVTVNWSGIGMVMLCSTLMIVSLHWFVRWLYGAFRADARWPWRWTFALYASFWILFGIVMGASGTMRQTSWLLQMTEPIYKARMSHYAELRMASGNVQSALLETHNDIHKTQALLLASRTYGAGAWDHHQYVIVPGASDRIERILVIPRDPEGQQEVGFAVIDDIHGGEHIPIERLAEFLSRE